MKFQILKIFALLNAAAIVSTATAAEVPPDKNLNHALEQGTMKIDFVKSHIETVRQELIDHDAFAWVSDLEKTRVFMESHVWAVWDFMVLLKSLQPVNLCGCLLGTKNAYYKSTHVCFFFCFFCILRHHPGV